MPVKDIIVSEMQQVAREQDKDLAPLTDDLSLMESGLDSLCFAILVTRLEDRLGFDPFTEADDAYYPVTLGDFMRFYEDAANRGAAGSAG